jgi:hypothetical protein
MLGGDLNTTPPGGRFGYASDVLVVQVVLGQVRLGEEPEKTSKFIFNRIKKR